MSKIPTEQELQGLFSKPLLKCKELKHAIIQLDNTSISLEEFISLADQHANFIFYEYTCFPNVEEIIETAKQGLVAYAQEEDIDQVFYNLVQEYAEELENYIGYTNQPMKLCLSCRIEDVLISVTYSDDDLIEQGCDLKYCIDEYNEQLEDYSNELKQTKKAEAREELANQLKSDKGFMKLTNRQARQAYVRDNYNADILIEANAYYNSDFHEFYTRYIKT